MSVLVGLVRPTQESISETVNHRLTAARVALACTGTLKTMYLEITFDWESDQLQLHDIEKGKVFFSKHGLH